VKKSVVTLIAVIGLAANVFAQGTISFENVHAGQLVYMPDGVTPADVFTVNLWGGSSAANLVWLASTDGVGLGMFYAGYDVVIPGVPVGGTATLRLFVTGPGGFWGDTGIFTNPTGGTGTPPRPGAYLYNPGFNAVPEPTSFALVSLGAVAMLIFRRKS
jgi:hypothetical protein